jgi:hypothetical protein
VDCLFWQRAGTGERDAAAAKDRWARGTERRFGAWGRTLWEDGRLAGMIQYGPSAAFAHARGMPAGPPSGDAALVTCAHLAGEDPAGLCERLLLECLADLKARRVRAVEAFALRHPPDAPPADRFGAHLTIFDRTFLLRFGFGEVREAGPVALMRLELGGLERTPAGALAALRARLAVPARHAPPAPA